MVFTDEFLRVFLLLLRFNEIVTGARRRHIVPSCAEAEVGGDCVEIQSRWSHKRVRRIFVTCRAGAHEQLFRYAHPCRQSPPRCFQTGMAGRRGATSTGSKKERIPEPILRPSLIDGDVPACDLC